MSDEIGNIIPIEILKKLREVGGKRKRAEWEKRADYMTGRDTEEQNKDADEQLKQRIIEREQTSG